MEVRDIFKDGASPELEAWWKERDDAIEAYKVSDSPRRKNSDPSAIP